MREGNRVTIMQTVGEIGPCRRTRKEESEQLRFLKEIQIGHVFSPETEITLES